MKYAIVFSSRTGNTARLAEVLKESMPQEDCLYFGEPSEKALTAPMIFVGFWTDKGSCDETARAFLETLKERQIFLFGTAGFGGSQAYFGKIVDAIKTKIHPTVRIVGDFMCQGEMPDSVLKRYEKMLADSVDTTHIKGMIDNFNSAVSHPDSTDLENFRERINTTVREWHDEKGC